MALTKKDSDRLDRAYKMNCIDWGVVSAWAKEADNEEGRRELNAQSSRMYHREEASIGLL